MTSRSLIRSVLATVVCFISSFATALDRELVIWGMALGPDSKGSDAMIREFEKRNPGVRVRVMGMGAGRMDPQKLMTAIVGNAAPDVIEQDRFTISDWASRGAFRPLDDLIERDRLTDPTTPTKEKYYEAPWAEASYGGKVYAIPSSADNRILYWNKARFREKASELRAAGLDPDRPPRTWSETLAYSKVLTEYRPDGTILKVGFMPNYGNSWLYMYAFQMDAKFLTEDGRTSTFYTPETEKALQFMVDGYDLLGGYEKARTFETGLAGKENDPFILGQVAMKIDGDWMLPDLARYGPQLDFGVAPPPVPDDRYFQRGQFQGKDPKVTWSGGMSWAIPRNGKNLEDGWKFIKFAMSTEGRLIAARAQRDWERFRGRVYVSPQAALIEANKALYDEFKPADPKFAAAIKQHVDMAPYGYTRPVTFVGQLMWSEQFRAFEAAVNHRQNPKEALLQSQAAVQRELDRFYVKERYPVIDLTMLVKGGIGLVGLLIAAFLLWFSRLRLGRIAKAEAKWAFLFVSPWVIGFLLLMFGPMLASLFFSFTQYDALNEARWVGGKNFSDMFDSDWPNTSKALGNAAYMASIGVPLGLFTGLTVALLLNAAVRGMRFYRTLFYMPAVVPGTASAVLWMFILTPDPNKGLINSVWVKTIGAWLGASPPGWLTSANWGKDALILMGLWGAGSGMVLWLAGLKGVPTSLYEAASIDGASPKQQFWSITFPQLTPIIFFNTVMGFIGAMQEFDRMYIMRPNSEGPIGPDNSLLTPVYHLFQNGFAFFKMGYASALAWMIFAIILILTAVQWKLAPRWVHYEGER
jgi:ABC-type sugar transport system permease subunit/ABC-type glycerol-3-phosphate transport system substrate-binding protein